MASAKASQHWPAMVLGVLVAAIFIVVLVTFEVKQTEFAIVKAFGSPKTQMIDGAERVKTYDPGLHWKLPYPFETVWKHDRRWQTYELKKGQVEQVQTADDYQIIVTTYVIWRVGDPGLYLKRLDNVEQAEAKLDDVIRNSRNSILGQHKLHELINVDASKMRLSEIEAEIRRDCSGIAMEKYGIEIKDLGFKHLGFPEKVSEKVFARMQAERQRTSRRYRSEGERDAMKIRAEADLVVSRRLAEAEAEAKGIRAEGDRVAAEYYAVFSQNPELAAFLRKLDALRKTLSEKTTLVVDTSTAPYDLFLPNATDLEKTAAAGDKKPAKSGDGK